MTFEPTRLAEYTDDALIAEIRRVANLVGSELFSTATFRKHARVGLTTLRRRFGGWREALEAASLAHLYNIAPPARISRTLGREWTKDQVIQEMLRVASLVGSECLTIDDFSEHAVVGVGTVRSRFNTWSNALRAAGLDSVNHGKRYTDEECFENLLQIWTHLGRQPKYLEMGDAPSLVGSKAYVQRWGTWNKAVHAFISYVESDIKPVSVDAAPSSLVNRSHNSQQRPCPEDQREIPMGLRYRVLKRDRFRCVSCGRSPATELGVELHIDHIHPFSKGGKTALDNLRALCADCNIGKGATLDA